MLIAVKLVTSTSTPVPAVGRRRARRRAARASSVLGVGVLRRGLGHGEPARDRAVVGQLGPDGDDDARRWRSAPR